MYTQYTKWMDEVVDCITLMEKIVKYRTWWSIMQEKQKYPYIHNNFNKEIRPIKIKEKERKRIVTKLEYCMYYLKLIDTMKTT